MLIGCYAQVATDEEKQKIGADVLIGTKDKNRIADLLAASVNDHKKVEDVQDVSSAFAFESMPIEQFESKHRAFLKVQDGCNQFCSYCIIPYARGRERSLSASEVVSIAKDLEKRDTLKLC